MVTCHSRSKRSGGAETCALKESRHESEKHLHGSGLFLLILAGFALRGQQEPTHFGRYQIIAYTVELANGQSGHQATVFKMDTATGQGWLYRTGMDSKGKFYNVWAPIEQQ
jgi:hypothetical protein